MVAGGRTLVGNADRAFAVGAGGHVVAVDLVDGRDVWRVRLEASPVVHVQVATADTVVASTQFGPLVGLSTRDGEVRWSVEPADGYWFTSAAEQGGLLIALAGSPTASDDRPPLVHALDVATGEQRWSVPLGAGEEPHCMPPLLLDDRVIVYAMPDGMLARSVVRALRLDDGSADWETPVGGSRDNSGCLESAMIATPGRVHVPLLEGGTVTLSLGDGTAAWTSELTLVAAVRDRVMLADATEVRAVEPGTGDGETLLGAWRPARALPGTYVESTGMAAAVDRARLWLFDETTGEVTAQVPLPTTPGDVVYVDASGVLLSGGDDGLGRLLWTAAHVGDEGDRPSSSRLALDPARRAPLRDVSTLLARLHLRDDRGDPEDGHHERNDQSTDAVFSGCTRRSPSVGHARDQQERHDDDQGERCQIEDEGEKCEHGRSRHRPEPADGHRCESVEPGNG